MNIKGNYDVEMFISISEDFDIGADKEGYAVTNEQGAFISSFFDIYELF